ncbi:FAD-dependent oxidoreductase [Patescibacteria group bacterium]|nr:FAD-dependent oxidoreductase [Patescibacteria group bacterium]MBU1727834.1 FAD-dependent oxidoreductase [Patescibacteria group bacterium]
MLYDLIIVGGGPAGSAAAIYASRKRLNTLLIASEFGGQSVVSEKIYNWIGTIAIAGQELANNLKNHVMANAGDVLHTKEGTRVDSVLKKGDSFRVKTSSGEEFEGKTILIATGSKRRKLEAENAERLEHKGLTYCATCDGPLFAGSDVVVIGGGNAAFESASQLSAYCNSVTILNRSNEFRADEITVEKVLKNPRIKVIKNAVVSKVKGEKFVEGLTYKEVNTGEEKDLQITGIFIEIGQIPNTDFVKDIVPLDNVGRIKIDPWTGKTETPGVWAAGDCTNVLYHQNNIAAGDAVKALEDIYLNLHTK